MTCSKKACPVLQCDLKRQEYINGECCPRCSGKRNILPVPDKCFFANNLFDEDSRRHQIDKCTSCVCSNGTFVCKRNTCPILDCADSYQTNNSEHCCPKCIIPEEFRSQCSYNGFTYQVKH